MVVVFGCKTARVYNVVDVPVTSTRPLTAEEVGARIDRAARIQAWTTEQIAPGHLIATKRKGGHAGTVTISYDASSFSIQLRNATNLKHSGDKIHKLYNEWVQELEETIRMEISSSD